MKNLMECDNIIIGQYWQALGDDLMYSTLPESFALLGKKVYTSSKNIIKNKNTHDLVWGMNPFISGKSDDEPNAGEALYPYRTVNLNGIHILDRPFTIEEIEKVHGLETGNSYPKVYYKPKLIKEVENKILVDLASNTMVYSMDEYQVYLSMMLRWGNYSTSAILQIAHEEPGICKQMINVPSIAQFFIKDIWHYCDVLASCAGFITVHSGAHVLAVALRNERREPRIHCMIKKHLFNSRMVVFKNVNYYIP